MSVAVICQFLDVVVFDICQEFQQIRGIRREAALTLIVNTNVSTVLTSAKHASAVRNGSEATVVISLGTQFANPSRIPASPFRVAVLPDREVGVQIEHTNLATRS